MTNDKQLPEGWRMVKFGDMAKHISKRVEPSETNLNIYVGLEHLDPDSLRIKRHGVPSDVEGQKLLVKKGQIIFGKRRAYQRKLGVAEWDCICSAHAMVLEANLETVLPEFLPFFMQSDVFMNRAVAISEGSLSPTIKWKILEEQEQLQKCLAFFPGVDRTVDGFEGLMAAQECLPTNAKRDEFAAAFGVLNKLWTAISPDPFLATYRQDFKWLAQIYESVRPVGKTGGLVWAALGPEVIKMIHEHTDIKGIRDDIDELLMDEHAVFTLTHKEQEKRARRLEINLMGILRGHGDPKFVALGERLEKLRQDYEAGVIKAIDWLKGLLDAAKDTVRMERELDEKVVTIEDNIQALTKLFLETRPDRTPQMLQDIVEQIDKIVKATRFEGWQNSNSGPREIQKALLLTLAQFGLGKDKDLFNKAYGYIEEHY